MSTSGLRNFLKSLDSVKQDLTCTVCLELPKNPVTLSKCFHIICSEHFEGLESCLACGVSLEGCKVFKDEQLKTCIDSTRQLENIFEPLKTTNEESHKQESSLSNADKNKIVRQKSTVSKINKEGKRLQKVLSDTNLNIGKRVTRRSSLNDNNKSWISNASSIKANKTLEKRNTKGETALHVACRVGKLDRISELLGKGANPNTKDNAGWTPLHEAVQNGRKDIVKLLLQHNILIDVPGQGNETPLHEAVRYGHKEIAEELVINGANIAARNCKGETPLQLAKGDMKRILETASENILQTQGINIEHLAQLYTELEAENIRIYSTSQYRTVQSKLKLLAKHHPNVYIDHKFTKKVTHLIVDTEDDYVCESSVEVLQAIVNGSWVLSSEWLIKCNENHLEPFQNYEVKGVGTTSNKGPKNARYNKYKQLPGIFNGCHIYIHNLNVQYEISKSLVITKPLLSRLISEAGGCVLRRVPNPESIPEYEKLVPYHAKVGGKLTNCSHFIIFKDNYEPMYNMQHIKALPIGWLIECLERYELCEPW